MQWQPNYQHHLRLYLLSTESFCDASLFFCQKQPHSRRVANAQQVQVFPWKMSILKYMISSSFWFFITWFWQKVTHFDQFPPLIMYRWFLSLEQKHQDTFFCTRLESQKNFHFLDIQCSKMEHIYVLPWRRPILKLLSCTHLILCLGCTPKNILLLYSSILDMTPMMTAISWVHIIKIRIFQTLVPQ